MEDTYQLHHRPFESRSCSHQQPWPVHTCIIFLLHQVAALMQKVKYLWGAFRLTEAKSQIFVGCFSSHWCEKSKAREMLLRNHRAIIPDSIMASSELLSSRILDFWLMSRVPHCPGLQWLVKICGGGLLPVAARIWIWFHTGLYFSYWCVCC